MKKVTLIYFALTVSMFFAMVSYSTAEQNISPPLLMEQPGAQPSIPGAPPVPPGPGGPLPHAAPPPPSPGIGQSIPEQTLLNNLPAAVVTAQKAGTQLLPGKVWTMQGPAGEIILKAGIMYQGTVVAVLNFNPMDGSVLPLGIPILGCRNINQVQPLIQRVKVQLTTIIRQLKILPAAEFRGPEVSWAFPIAFGNKIVTFLKVYYDGIHIVPDYPANQEMTCYGQ